MVRMYSQKPGEWLSIKKNQIFSVDKEPSLPLHSSQTRLLDNMQSVTVTAPR